MLPLGLTERSSKVRTSLAYAVSAVAHWDWPEEWPTLFDTLMQALASGDSDLTHGAMRVLTGRLGDALMSWLQLMFLYWWWR